MAKVKCVPSVLEMTPRSTEGEAVRRAGVSRSVSTVGNWSLLDLSESLGAGTTLLYDGQGVRAFNLSPCMLGCSAVQAWLPEFYPGIYLKVAEEN